MADRPYQTQRMWSAGVNSVKHPADLGEGEVAWAENVVNRGGIWQTRPGYRVIASIPGTRLQGLAMFTPRNSTARLVAVVDGKVYAAEYPAYNFTQVAGITLDAYAPRVQIEPSVQSAKLNGDGSLALITPTPTITITDGVNRAGYWNGTNAGHLTPGAPNYGPPAGCLWQAWVGSRLWLSQGRRIFVSDLVNPLQFSENQYLSERSNFDLPDECTGLKKTTNELGLLAFTTDDTTAFKAYIHDRTQWALTNEFQKIIIPGIGCVAGRSIVNAYGETYWFTRAGLISLNAALNTLQSSTLDVIDNAMMRSKRCLCSDLSGVAGCAFENYLLMSVPYADIYNAHTWALDKQPINGRREQAWNGVWSGVRPVQWATGQMGGKDRCYFASYDKSPLNDTHIHIWEAFQANREDEGGQIACQVELAPTASNDVISFKCAEAEVVEMLGDVTLASFVGGGKGAWHATGEATYRAQKGSMGGPFQRTFTTTDILQAYKPQQRIYRTEEFSAQGAAASPETPYVAGQDKLFSLLLEWRGRMGFREVRYFVATGTAKDQKGEVAPDESTQPPHAVTERGVSVTE